MDRLEKVIDHVRALRALGATQVSIGKDGSVEVSFAPPVVPEAEVKEPTAEERKAVIDDILLHSAS